MANTDSYSATSISWPSPLRARSCRASSTPITPYSEDSESPMLMPTRTGAWPG